MAPDEGRVVLCEPNGFTANGSCVCQQYWSGRTCRSIECAHGTPSTGLVANEHGLWVHGPLCQCDLLYAGRHCTSKNWMLLFSHTFIDKLVLVAITVFVFCAGATFISYMMHRSRQERDLNEEELFVGRTVCTFTDATTQTEQSSSRPGSSCSSSLSSCLGGAAGQPRRHKCCECQVIIV